MKITCDSCGSHYKIADDKVRGRRVKVRCKSCGKTLVVDGAADGAGAAAEAGPVGTALAGGGVSPDTWSVNLNESDQRTMTTAEIVAGYRAGWVSPDIYVWRDGMTDWTPLMEVPELSEAIGPATPAAAEPVGGAALGAASSAEVATAAAGSFAVPRTGASARISGGRAQRGADLFGGVAQAGGEDEARTPLMAGTQPYDDPRPTGARNENSVLFSLDALKVGFAGGAAGGGGGGGAAVSTGPKPKAPPRRSGAPSNPEDPFGMGSDSLAGIGGSASPLFSFGTNQALLTAAPPPEPPRVAAADQGFGQGSTFLPPLERKTRPSKVVIVGAALAALLVGGIVIASMGGEDEKELAAAETKDEQAAEKTAASEKAAEENKEEPKPEEKPEEKKAEEETAAAKPAVEDKKPVAAVSKPKSGAAAKPAAAKPEATKPQVKQQVSDGVASFNKGAAIAALSSAASAASGCKRPGGPTGGGRAIVTFAPSGRVTSANVQGGSFGGTSVGGCIASVFRRATVPAFSGSPVTVSKSFSISP
jgi:predicted Zn finger-like uncharacterized protein